jgi:hypothetical protein
VIHTNAALIRLTGIDSHTVVGKPISELLIIKMNASERIDDTQQQREEQGTSNHGDTSSHRTKNRGRQEIGFDRLVVSSGLGQFHVVQVRMKQHHMIGRNVTIVMEGQTKNSSAANSARQPSRGERGSSESAHFEDQLASIQCRASIAPIVSATSSLDYANGIKIDKESKRVKLFADQSSHRRYLPSQLVTHYVIQLQPLDETSEKQGIEESLSSNSGSRQLMEARLLGIPKDELRRKDLTADCPSGSIDQLNAIIRTEGQQQDTGHDEDASNTESSTNKLHVAAVG